MAPSRALKRVILHISFDDSFHMIFRCREIILVSINRHSPLLGLQSSAHELRPRWRRDCFAERLLSGIAI